MKRVNFFIFSALLLAACTSLATPQVNTSPTAATSANRNSLVHVRLPVGYIPNIQFAPLYVAIDKGYFKQAGLDVTLDYSTEIDNVTLVGTNNLQFAIASGDQILPARAQGIPVVYVMAWYQGYPVGIASKTAQGIKAPKDLAGKKIGIPILSGASYIGFRALLNAGGLTEKDVSLETVGFNQVETLTTDREQAIVIYVTNEPIVLQSQGTTVNVLRVSDYIKLVSNGLITNETTIKDNPDLVKHMVQAILHGLQDTINNPDEAYQISKNYIPTLAQADPKVNQDILLASIDLWKTQRLGFSDPQAWQNMQKVQQDIGLLAKPLDINQAFTNQFIP
jgi:NitT/TauT family transport system substrate-binding protein